MAKSNNKDAIIKFFSYFLVFQIDWERPKTLQNRYMEEIYMFYLINFYF